MDIKVRANTKGKNKEDYPKDNKRLDDFFNLTNNKRFRENESNSDDNDRVSNHNISSSLPINLIDDSFEDPILEDNSQSKKSKKAKRNRDSCSICRTGGELILCDNCPKSFHKECLKIKSVPEGDWFCPSCLPIKERRFEKIKEIDEKRRMKNEKRRLWRLKKKEEMLRGTGVKNASTPGKDSSGSSSVGKSLPARTSINVNLIINEGNVNSNATFPLVHAIPSETQRKLTSDIRRMESTLQSKLKGNTVLESFFKPASSITLIDLTSEDKAFTEEKTKEEYQNKVLEEINKNMNSIKSLNALAETEPLTYSDVNTKYWNNMISKKLNKNQKFPIDDKELYDNPEIYSIGEEYFNKPKGSTSLIPNGYLGSIYKIWDFICTFKLDNSGLQFTPEQLYFNLNNYEEKENSLVTDVHVCLLKVVCNIIDKYDYATLEPEMMMIKVMIANSGKSSSEFLRTTWPEILRQIANSEIFSLMVTDDIRLITKKNFDTVTYNLSFSLDEKLNLLNYIINSIVDSEFIRNKIKEDLENRNELRKTKRDYEEELRMTESRKRELERQEKFTQPRLKIEDFTKRLATLNEDNPSLSRHELSKLRKELEGEREQYKSVIKELEGNEDRRLDILNKIEKLSNEIHEIPSVNKKLVGVDGLGREYYFYSSMPWKLILKTKSGTKREWTEITTDEELKDLVSKLSEKGIKESSLLTKLKKLYPKRLKFNHEAKSKTLNSNQIATAEPMTTPYEEIAEQLCKLEGKITEYLYQDEKEWESYDIREGLKAWVSYINKLPEYVKTLILFNERIKGPYKINEIKPSKMIVDDEDYEGFHSLINHTTDSLDPYKINPKRTITSKARLWSKEFEALGMEDIFLEYLNTVSTTSGMFLSVFIFDAVLNDLLKRREFYKRKPEDFPSETKIFEKPTVNETKSKYVDLNDFDEYNYDDDEYSEEKPIRRTMKTRASTRRQVTSNSLNVNSSGMMKRINWKDECYICGEPGKLVCCEDCPNVGHLFCIGQKKEPEVWRCEDCTYRLVNKRMTRSSRNK